MANKNKKYKRSIEDAGRILDEDKYTSYITTGGAGYVPQNNIDINSRLYNNLSPIGYEDLSRVPKAIFLNKPDIYHNKMKYMPVLDEIYAQYLGIPEENRHFNKRLEKSKYKPTQGGENVTYYKLPQKTVDGRTILGDDHRYSGSSNTFVDTMVFDATYMNPGKNKQQLNTELGYYTVGRGRDNKGDYVSYYDKWDINPFSGRLQNNTVLPTNIRKMLKDINLDFGVPVNIYDRIHFDDYYGVQGGDRGGHYLPEVIITNERKKHKNGGVHYKVKKGDTLSKIAKQYTGNALRYNELSKLNGIENPDKIEIGQDIIIPKQFLDTVKDTNLQEVIVTGNKNNKLINKIKDPNVKHEEVPSSLIVQKRNFNNPVQQSQPNIFIDDIIQNSTNLLQQGTNYIIRQYEKIVDDKDSASTLKIPNKTKPKNKLNKVYNIIPKSYTGDTIKIDKNKYIIPESINLNDVKLGTRNRGSIESLNTEGAIITNFDPYIPYDRINKNNNTTTYMGVDKKGNFKVGTIDNFSSGDLLTKTYANDVISFAKDSKGNQLFKSASGGNRFRNVPIINVIENGKIKQGSLNFLSNKNNKNNNTYGSITGGRIILEVGNERRLVSGSLNDIEKQFNDIKKRHGAKKVRMYTLDNGTYNTGLRTKNRIISASDLRSYDNQNSGGGNFMYLLDDKNFNKDTSSNKRNYERLINDLSKSSHYKKLKRSLENRGK